MAGTARFASSAARYSIRFLARRYQTRAAFFTFSSPPAPAEVSRLIDRRPAAASRAFFCRHLGFSLDPDFYEIPVVYGVPKGSKLKLYNLPPTDDREKLKKDLIQWFLDLEENLTVTSFEFTDDPKWNAEGVGAFIEFETKMQAATAYARLDASKFQGRYVRMNFVERDPFPPKWLAQNEKWFTGEYALEGVVVPNSKVFVGNLSYAVDDKKLEEIFSAYGTVYVAKVMKDKETGRSRGFGFVTMSNDEEMNKAIQGLNGKLVDGRYLKVNSAQNKPEQKSEQKPEEKPNE